MFFQLCCYVIDDGFWLRSILPNNGFVFFWSTLNVPIHPKPMYISKLISIHDWSSPNYLSISVPKWFWMPWISWLTILMCRWGVFSLQSVWSIQYLLLHMQTLWQSRRIIWIIECLPQDMMRWKLPELYLVNIWVNNSQGGGLFFTVWPIVSPLGLLDVYDWSQWWYGLSHSLPTGGTLAPWSTPSISIFSWYTSYRQSISLCL